MDDEFAIEIPETTEAAGLASEQVRLIQAKLFQCVQDLAGGQTLTVFVPLADGSKIRATSFGYDDPDMVKVVGLDPGGNDVSVMLHKTALQVVMEKSGVGPGIDPKEAFAQPVAKESDEETPPEMAFDERA